MFGRLGEEVEGQFTAAYGIPSMYADLYLCEDSGHRPTEKQAVLASLVSRAKIICYAVNLIEEVEHLNQASEKIVTATGA